MYSFCVFIDAVTLRRLYIDEMLTTAEVAAFQVRPEHSEATARAIRNSGSSARPAPGRLRVRVARRSAVVGKRRIRCRLIATDGNLGRKRASISVVSKDIDLLETVRRCLGLTAPVKPHVGGYGTICHHIVWRDRRSTTGSPPRLTPAKSLTLGPLMIPDEFFADFFRGCIDGDGSIVVYTDRYHVSKNHRYIYERLYLSIVSASRYLSNGYRRPYRDSLASLDRSHCAGGTSIRFGSSAMPKRNLSG